MSEAGRAKKWLVRVGIATAILTVVGIFAQPGQAMAAGAEPPIGSETWAILVFALVWFLGSLRIRRSRGRLRLGFEPATVRRTSSAWARGGRSARVPGGSSGGAGASANY